MDNQEPKITEPKMQEFTYESMEEKENIIQMLQALQNGFQNKKIILKDKTREIVLSPQGLIKANLSVKSQNSKNKVTIQFKWKEKN